MPAFNLSKWERLCREELETLRSSEEAAAFRHMRSRFEAICRRMVESDGQPGQREMLPSTSGGRQSPPRPSGPLTFYRSTKRGAMPQLANRIKRIRLDDDTGTAGRLKSQIVVPVDKIHMATNDATAANKILHGRSNMTVHTVDSFESMLDHIVDLEQQKILVVVWQGQLLPDVLKDLVDTAKPKSQFLSVLTSTETEAHAEHTQLPDDEDMLAVMGRRILKAATNAGLKPTRNPIS
ncbi:hypothetical protein AAVH_12493 [Aphelenchoides avenae]|nr:hypothetical protein AAVH_12493 [Aphelenchus avenae]